MAPITFDDLSARVHEYASDCWDDTTPSDRLWFAEAPADNSRVNYLVNWTSEGNLFQQPTVNQVALGDRAKKQIADRLDAPEVAWLFEQRRCPPNLATDILDRLSKERAISQLMLRCKGQSARAILSAEYVKFDNVQLVDMLSAALETMGTTVQVHRAEIGDDLRAYVLFPQITFGETPPPAGTQPGLEPGAGDGTPGIGRRGGDPNGKLHPAIYLGNSEVGGGRVRILGALYQSVCSNGMIYGWQAGEMTAISHRYLSAGVMHAVIADGLAVAMRMTEKAAQAFVKSQEIHVTMPDLRGMVNVWSQRYGLETTAGTDWLNLTLGEAAARGRSEDVRLFDVVNAATFYSGHRENSEEREKGERMAGDLLMSVVENREWAGRRRLAENPSGFNPNRR